MTLVLTHLSDFGVAMAADSAITDGRGRAVVGAQKLQPAYLVGAGLSVWGHGEVAGTPADEWLANFIATEIHEEMRLWQLARGLAEALNGGFGGTIQDRMGVHVGGFDEAEGGRGPAFYHVHNGHYHVGIRNGRFADIPDEDPPIREFRCHPDHALIRKGDELPRLVRNGDFWLFSLLFDRVRGLLRDVDSETGLKFPYPDGLAVQGEYLRFWINIIKEIYRLSNARPRIVTQPATAGDASIGGPVTVLTISESRIETFYAR